VSFTCYAALDSASLGALGPPAQINVSAAYYIVDTATNTAVTCAGGQFSNSVNVFLNTPVASQQAILPAVQSAIQAAEPARTGLAFIWIGL